ncbi:hypothetical protein CLPUN_10290 [Clostridium puniceum]|uniref:Uncharacterized protein n=1 Tax=Clostridium puniceum TaxID=29367 RepID=A0A1S8TV82_9CLOT|nr:hypothetical protein [Clostridium puniceum]OOM81640.1 hypothetical protein CLPUN_10290 [Clostridium puniceum]
MKLYTIQEVFEEAIGTEFEVVGNMKTIKVADGVQGRILCWSNGEKALLSEVTIAAKFIKIPKPVSFMDVVNSDKKCRIEHELVDNEIYEKEYHDFREVIRVMTTWYSTKELKQVIREGKWYLE